MEQFSYRLLNSRRYKVLLGAAVHDVLHKSMFQQPQADGDKV